MSGTGGTVADLVARACAERAADRAFVFPGGGSNLEVIAALERHGVEIVLARSEGGAALMAAAYADLTGRPAVVLVGVGPGAASVANGLAHALLDQSALVVIGDRLTEAERARTGHQVIDQLAVLSPVTKWQSTLSVETAGEQLAEAFSTAARPPRGPVHLELDREVATAQVGPERRTTGLRPGAPEAGSREPKEWVEAVALLGGARRPLVLVGDEALTVPQASLVALVELLGAPVLCSYKGKGAMPEEHELWCGIVTNAALEEPLLRQADAILAVGLDPVELLSRPWPADAPVIPLREHAEPVPGYGGDHVFIGDLATLVPELVSSLAEAGREPDSEWPRGEIARARAAMLSAIRINSPDSLSALEVVELVQAQAPDRTIVTVDAGAHMFAVTWGWRSRLPRRFLISNGIATMGFAVPAAIAAALARPDEPVIAFTGDGGFLLHGSELETAVRIGARLVVVVLNDAGLSLIRIKQEERRYPRTAVDFGPVDAAAYARALGATGAVADTEAGVSEAVRSALRQSGPAVIDVRISGQEYGELQRVIRVTGTREEALFPR
jgi:acetolactate synthase I/II/III large subunit